MVPVTADNAQAQAAPTVSTEKRENDTVPAKLITKQVAVPPVSPSWHTAFTYTGQSSTNSKSFHMQGSHWRVTYSCDATGQFPGVLVMILGADSANVGQSESFGSSIDNCPPSRVYDFYNHTPGLYALNTSASNASYTITVEDFY